MLRRINHLVLLLLLLLGVGFSCYVTWQYFFNPERIHERELAAAQAAKDKAIEEQHALEVAVLNKEVAKHKEEAEKARAEAEKQRQEAERQRQEAEKQKEYVRNLVKTEYVAEVWVKKPVLSFDFDGMPHIDSEELEFVEFDANHKQVFGKKVTIKGKRAQLLFLKATFDDEYVEKNDPLRGKPILLFRSLHATGESIDQALVNPKDQLHGDGEVPPVYTSSDLAFDLQQKVWTNFAVIAQDPAKAEALGLKGLRAADGESLWTEFEPGRRYIVVVKAGGDISFKPVEMQPVEMDDDTKTYLSTVSHGPPATGPTTGPTTAPTLRPSP